jgi:hypothetical protein
LEIPISEVVKVLNDTFEFNGWSKDLPINPIRLFHQYTGQKSSVMHFTLFVGEVNVELSKYPDFEGVKAEKLFYMCETYTDIEERIQNEWI